LASRTVYTSRGRKVAEIMYSNCTPGTSKGGNNCTAAGVRQKGIRRYFGEHELRTDTNGTTMVVPISLGGNRVAEIAIGKPASEQRYFVHDNTGSVAAVLNGTGT